VVALRNGGLRSLSWARFPTPCWTFIRPDAHRSTEVSAWNFRQYGQRETVPSGFVELSTYRVNRTSDG